MAKQEPRPAYHRRQDLKRLKAYALDLPVVVEDLGPNKGYAVQLLVPADVGTTVGITGRYEVVYAFLTGARIFHALNTDGIPLDTSSGIPPDKDDAL